MKREIVLKGEGANAHVLEGDFVKTENIFKIETALLKHETPTGEFAEHKTLNIPKGYYIVERQNEFNPFDEKVTNIFD